MITDMGHSTDISTDMSANGHTDKRPYIYTAASVRYGVGVGADNGHS